ncbi:hypothetical protein J6590_095252 [Homalodisca vitripennis]|nr:hypothetical protein J6590_095252 [Homalodisca vitripennis]
MEFEADRNRTAEGDPSLAEMARTALSLLMKNPRGFFQLVESRDSDSGTPTSLINPLNANVRLIRPSKSSRKTPTFDRSDRRVP